MQQFSIKGGINCLMLKAFLQADVEQIQMTSKNKSSKFQDPPKRTPSAKQIPDLGWVLTHYGLVACVALLPRIRENF